MTPRPFLVAFLGVSTLSACGGPACESGTLVAQLTFDDAARTADTLVVKGTINGQTMTASEPYTGQTQIRVPFPGVAYSKGLVVDVYVEARKGNGIVATAGAAEYSLPSTCAVLPLTFDESGTRFSVSGQVVGLLGSGFVLTDGEDSLPIAQNGPFTFPMPISSGQAFEVKVMTPPSSPTQSCTVTNGAGFIDDRDITNVQVDCTTGTYTIGGTIAGLMSDGLQLEETTSLQIVTLSQFGTSYTFPTALASGTAYTVTVHQQPTTQSCTFDSNNATSVSGTIADMNLTDLNLTCVGN